MTQALRFLRPLVILALLLTGIAVQAQTRVPLITFGGDAPRAHGDDDFTQSVFIKLPADTSETLYLRLFDPDCGGGYDEEIGPFNTKTRFTLLGGAGASRPGPGGTEIIQREFGQDPTLDNRWLSFPLDLAQGERVDDVVYFRLVVEGLGGDDGNLFDVAVSSSAKLNRLPAGVELLSYSPAASIPKVAGRFAEARVKIPSRNLTIRNFDMENHPIWFETPLRSDFPLAPSAEGEWQETRLELPAEMVGEVGAIVVGSSRVQHNNIVLQARDNVGQPVPIQLPILLQRANTRPEPQAVVRFLSDCQAVLFDAGNSSDKQNDVLSYRWDFGDGEQGEGTRVLHQYPKPGRYTYTLTASDDSGRIANRAKRRQELLLNQPPQAVPGARQIAAPGQTVSFDGTPSHDPDGRITHFAWNFGDGSPLAQGAKVNHAYDRPGLYKVKLRVEDDSTSPCNAGEAATEVWVNARPQAEAGPDQVVSPQQSVRFDATQSFDSDGELRHYDWDFGDGGQGLGTNPTHAYAQPGTYTVRLTIHDDAEVANSQHSDTLTITVNQHPLAKPQSHVERIAVDEPVRFDGGASSDADGAITAHAWDFGDGATADGAKVAHPYAQPGTYTVTLKVTDDTETSSATNEAQLTIIVNDPPVAEAGADQHVTESLLHFDASASLDRDGAITAYAWDFGDGGQGKGAQISHVYRAPGEYTVTLRVTDDSGTATQTTADTLTVRVNAKPVADAGPDRLLVPDETVQFDGTGSFDPDGAVQTYWWDFGDGDTSTEASPSHAYAEPGRYQVFLRVADDTGHEAATAHDQAIVVVNAQPIAVAGPDQRVAPGQVVVLDGSHSTDVDGKITHWEWTLSDGKTLSGPKARHAFAEPGLYTATLRVSDDSQASNRAHEDKLTIQVNHAPLANAGADQQTCDHRVRFDGGGSSDPDNDPLRYTWNFGDGTPPREGQVVEHDYVRAGTYPVTLEVNDRGGLDNAVHRDSMQVTINQAPLAQAGGAVTGCAGEMILFDGSRSKDPEGGRLKYLWDFGDDTKDEGMNPAKRYDVGGLYAVTLTVEDDSGLPACQVGQDRIQVRVAEAPLAEAGPDQTVCANAPLQFDGGQSTDFDGVVNAYDWDFGDGHRGGGKAPSHIYAAAGEYRVTLTITGDKVGQCSNRHSDFAKVNVIAAPLASFEAPDRAPMGAPVVFDAGASSPNAKYAWDFGDGNQAEGRRVEHTFAEQGNVFVALTVTAADGGECATATTRQALVVNAPPVAHAGEAKHVRVHESVVFDASESSDPDGIIRDYRWDFGDGEQAEGVRVTHQYRAPGTYPAKLVVDDGTELANSQVEALLEVKVNAPPQPNFTLPPVACPGETLTLDATASQDADGEITQFRWDFGDGGEAEGAQVEHTFHQPGEYTVILSAQDDFGETRQLTRRLRVNQAPLVPPRAPQVACPGPIQFSAADARDVDGQLTKFQWRVGDEGLRQGRELRYNLASLGRYPMQLTVEDDSASTCAATTVEWPLKVNSTPAAKITLHANTVHSGGVHDAVLFDASDSTDGDHDALHYAWDFGDKTQAEGAKVWHAFARPGNYTVRLSVQDDTGSACATGVAKRVVTVKGR